MNDLSQGLIDAFSLLLSCDTRLLEIIIVSLKVSFTAVFFSAMIGLPVGALLAILTFPGKRIILILFDAMMSFPPVLIGLFVYLMLSRSGPLGPLGLLFTPTAMIMAQIILVTPIIATLSRQIMVHTWLEYRDLFVSLDAGKRQILTTLLWDRRTALVTAILAGFGRAIAEMGAVIIVGGNIEHATRVLTTAIALETSKGDLPMAMSLGIILMILALAVNACVHILGGVGKGGTE